MSIPLIIHLLSLRKTREVNFSSIRFIDELKHESIRRLQWKQWLLVFLRMLIIAALVIMFARPVQHGFIPGWMAGEQETRLIMIVDNSASMALKTDIGTLMEHARTLVPEIAGSFTGQTAVEVWQTNPVKMVFKGSAAEQELAAATATIRQTFSRDDIWGVTETILKNTIVREPNRECFIISDFQSNPPPDFYSTISDSLKTPWRFYFISQPEPEHNLSIREGSVTSQVRLPNHIMKISTVITNDGEFDQNQTPVELYLNDQRVGQVVSTVRAGNTKDFIFEAFPGKTGIIRGQLRLPEDDFLPDNSLTFELPIPDQIATLVVSPQPEARFLVSTALAAIAPESNYIFNEARSMPVIDHLSLDETDILVLINPGRISDRAILQIQSFLSDGGGVIWILGDRFQVDSNGILLAGLNLPHPVEQVAFGEDNFVPATTGKDLHPLMEEMSLRNFDTELPRIYRYLKVDPPETSQPVLSLENGDPLLLDISNSAGRQFVFTSLIDLNWNDFALRGILVPLLHRMLLYLATDETNNRPVLIDETKTIRLDRDIINSKLSVKMPSGITRTYIPDFDQESLNITETDELGSYTVLVDDSPFTAFSTRLSPAEYPSKRVSPDLIKGKFPKDAIRWIQPTSALTVSLQDIRLGKSLWRYFLIAAILLIFAETLLSRVKPAELKSRND